MVNSFAMMRAGSRQHTTRQFIPRVIVPEKPGCRRRNFQHFLRRTEPIDATSVSYRGTVPQDKIAVSIRHPQCHSGDISMVLTTAHIQPIVALIAGILILIMPRFLNLVVAIYLIFIGLAGLGLFKMLHT
jgi:Protein of unknown function (DUF3096)